jgi:tRNA1Val (adenine37-N6)-methyltransferase
MSVFKFKHFDIVQKYASQKIGTDSMILGALATWKNPKQLLDIGTGTAVLALMCAQRFQFEKIIALEINKMACKDALINIANSPFKSSIELINEDVGNSIWEVQFDAIICNPPYFENSLVNPEIGKSIARHTLELPFDTLLAKTSSFLTKKGSAWFIFPFESKERITRLCSKYQLYIHSSIQINGKKEKPIRIILEVSKAKTSCPQIGELTIRDENGNYTESYKNLTLDYHLNTLS